MDRFRDWIRRFMQGRYGVDELEQFIMYLSLGIILVNFFVGSSLLSTLVTILVLYSLFRMLSRNHAARRAENTKFLQLRMRFLDFFRGGRRKVTDKDHKYFRCPKCNQMVRVPRGKGHIAIRCPKCSHEFIRDT